MKLIELHLNEYLDILQSDAPAPGGGSVSALAGAQGAALLSMVCDLTLAKEKFAEEHELCAEIREKAGQLYENFAKAIDEDTEAFNLVAAAFKMPKDTDEEKAARRKAIADGTLESTKVPFRVMQMAAEALTLADRVLGHYNRNCDSDYGVGVLNLLTCIRGAWLNVKINLPGVKDEELAAKYEAEGRKMIADSEEIAERIYKEIEEAL